MTLAVLVALSAIALVDSAMAAANFAGAWTVLGVEAAIAIGCAVSAIGPRSAPRFARAAAATLALPLCFLVLGLAAIAETGAAGLGVLALTATVIFAAPFVGGWWLLGRWLIGGRAAGPANERARSALVLVAFGAVWLRARCTDGLVLAGVIVLVAGLGLWWWQRRHATSSGHDRWVSTSVLVAAALCVISAVPPALRGHHNRPRPRVDTPTPVAGLRATPPRAVVMRNGGACATYSDQAAYCWGENMGRFLGDDDRPFSARAFVGGPAIDALALGTTAACAIDPRRQVWCWKGDVLGKHIHQPGTPMLLPMPPATRLFAGPDHGCVLDDLGALRCFPFDGERAVTMVATDVETAVVARKRVCSISKQARVRCHPLPGARDADDDETINLPTPARSIAVYEDTGWAALADGTVVWWGDPYRQGIGTRESRTAVPFPLPEPAVEIVAGREFACARSEAKRLWCWGKGGAVRHVDVAEPPSVVEGTGKIDSVHAGDDEVCVVGDAGVRCFGRL